ncbi:MAG TPA: heavy metal sensor histidine kinase [Pseudomonadales bacterium]|jgi:two-component system heavy metal sensor histidine kinase CusS|nr:heavy metal sensor histidine kinase [Pseudomonadales bacterium]
MRIRDLLLPTHSIVLRTALLFALLTASVITVMGLVVRTAVNDHFANMDRSQMAGKLELLQQALAGMHSPDDTLRIQQELDRALVGHHDLLVRIDDVNSQLWFQAGHDPIPPDKRTAPSWEAEGTPYRGMTATTASGYRITVGIDISHHQQFLHAFERELLMIGLCGLSAMALLGFLVTHRGLAPVQGMTDLVARSSAQQLGNRLAVNTMPVELRELAAAFNDMLDRIGESLTRLSEFSSDLAHELRTPINNLMTQTQVSLSKPRNAEEYRETLYANLEEYERLARMIGDMLFLAKADHGLVIPSAEPVKLHGTFEALCEFYEAFAAEKSIKFIINGEASINCDKLMLQRAFGNLMENAIRHSHARSTIKINIEAVNSTANISIENTGDTISQEQLPRLFDRFYRADFSRQRNDEGSGLGLAITQSIIKAHAGNISATSKNGVTKFDITFTKNKFLTSILKDQES